MSQCSFLSLSWDRLLDKPLARLKKVYMEPGQTRNVEGFVIGPDIRILLGVRTLILLIGVPFLAYAHEVLTPTVVSALVLVICLIGVVTAVGWISLANTNKSRHFQKRQIVADLLLVTLLVYGSGGSSSPFLVLYPLLIMMVATRSRRQALILGFVTGLGYWVLAQSLLLHKIPTLFVSQAISAPVGGLFMQILGLVSAMILIAVCTSHLSRRGKIFFEESLS